VNLLFSLVVIIILQIFRPDVTLIRDQLWSTLVIQSLFPAWGKCNSMICLIREERELFRKALSY